MNIDFEWRNKGYVQLPDGRWQAELNMLATYVAGDVAFGDSDILNAITAGYGIKRNGPHPFAVGQPNLTCNFFGVVSRSGPMAANVKAIFEIPPMGAWLDDKTNPMAARPMIKWDVCYKEVPTEFDVDGRLYCNSAGFPPANQETRRVKTWTLTLTRYEPFFNLGLADYAMNTVNNAPVTIGPYQFDTGQIYVDKICPPAEYQAGTNYLLMTYALEFDSHAKNPYQRYLRDQGSYGWAKSATNEYFSGPFGTSVTVAGQTVFVPFAEPILLDGLTGVPYAFTGTPTIQVGQLQADGATYVGKTPVAAPMSGDWQYQPCTAIPRPRAYGTTNPVPWIRCYRKVAAIDLGVLQLGFA